ncbi:hypothetical protein NPIL_413071 [Nephila pilipes]|uniref:Uncharacterized protein n=1 Tax=Nephila pilipes TaxID=299642 RepID=A0A8X6NL19_NEPPI|nr:hypothetical protein NPIL_413071 [Nephila pilipes]
MRKFIRRYMTHRITGKKSDSSIHYKYALFLDFVRGHFLDTIFCLRVQTKQSEIELRLSFIIPLSHTTLLQSLGLQEARMIERIRLPSCNPVVRVVT